MSNTEFTEYAKSRCKRTSSFFTALTLMAVDAIAIMLSVGTSFFIINAIDHSLINFRSFYSYGIYLPLILIVFHAAKLYPGIMMAPAQEIKNIGICLFFCMLGIAFSIMIDDDHHDAITVALILAAPIGTLLVPGAREFARRQFSRSKNWGVAAVVYGSADNARPVIDRLLNRPDFGYKPLAIITKHKSAIETYRGVPVFSAESGIEATIHRIGIKVAITCDSEYDIAGIMASYRYTIKIPRRNDAESMFHEPRDFGGIIGFATTNFLTKRHSLLIKRALDIGIILFFSPLILPVCAVLAVLVKCTSKGPVLYGHKRIGKNGRPFKCWKFRSMVVDADKMLEKILAENPAMRAEWEKDYKFEHDPRVTKIGAILRKTSLDEIPQLWNIFVGEMSFAGPRPVTKPELDRYGDKVGYILQVQPGLSGMWQISGRSDTGYEERISLDMYYIQNWSIWLDFWIMQKTVWVVLKGKGAY